MLSELGEALLDRCPCCGAEIVAQGIGPALSRFCEYGCGLMVVNDVPDSRPNACYERQLAAKDAEIERQAARIEELEAFISGISVIAGQFAIDSAAQAVKETP